MGIRYRVLFCETNKIFSQISDAQVCLKSPFIGYDYAYTGGSYYSCVLNDIVSKHIVVFKYIQLNAEGIFDKYEEVKEFSELREKMVIQDEEYTLLAI